MKKFKTSVVILLCLALVVLSGCASKQTPTTPTTNTPTAGKLTGEFLIGQATALTGPWAPPSELQMKAMDLAIEEVNASGMLGDAKLKVVREDSINTTEAAVQAVQNLLLKHKVKAVFGVSTGAQSLVALPQVQDAKIIAFEPCLNRKVNQIGDYIFGTLPTYSDLIKGSVDEQVKKLGFKTAAIVVPSDNDTANNNNAVRKPALEAAGVKIVAEVKPLNSDTDFTAIITKIMQANPDVVYTQFNPPADPLFLSQLKRAGYKGKIFGDSGNGSDTWYTKYADAYEGMYNITAYLPGIPTASQKTKDFEKTMMAKYPNAVLDQFQVGMYDSIWALAQAIKEAGTLTDEKAIRDKLAAIKVEGARGTITYDQDRMPSPSAYMIQVKNGKSTPVN